MWAWPAASKWVRVGSVTVGYGQLPRGREAARDGRIS
jgi:hypothetical protein